jgi:hypothetical protein
VNPVTPHPDGAQPFAFGRSDAGDLSVLRILREATSRGIALRWRLAARPLLPLRTHVHLLPPIGGVDAETNAYAAAWADRYRYGSFYYRHGPGFVTVKDVRPDGPARRMVISDGAAEFLAMVTATTIEGLTGTAQRALPDAVDAGLVLVAGRHIHALPFRMRHWPVPFAAV